MCVGLKRKSHAERNYVPGGNSPRPPMISFCVLCVQLIQSLIVSLLVWLSTCFENMFSYFIHFLCGCCWSGSVGGRRWFRHLFGRLGSSSNLRWLRRVSLTPFCWFVFLAWHLLDNFVEKKKEALFNAYDVVISWLHGGWLQSRALCKRVSDIFFLHSIRPGIWLKTSCYGLVSPIAISQLRVRNIWFVQPDRFSLIYMDISFFFSFSCCCCCCCCSCHVQTVIRRLGTI